MRIRIWAIFSNCSNTSSTEYRGFCVFFWPTSLPRNISPLKHLFYWSVKHILVNFIFSFYPNENWLNFKGLLQDVVLIAVAKFIFKRSRPNVDFAKNGTICPDISVDKYSFPSGHSSRSIFISNILPIVFANEFNFSFAATAALNTLSLMTCLSRVLLARHYLTDVLVGSILGYLNYLLVVAYFFIS